MGPIVLNEDVPKWLKMVMLFIDRVGFPVLAFLLMFYLCFSSLTKMTAALQDNSAVLRQMKETSQEFQTMVKVDHTQMKDCEVALVKDISDLKQYSYGYQDHVRSQRRQ